MRYLSLFSGIEAASCAWQSLGWELAGVCEIEKFPCNVLKHHYPDVPNLGDITQVGKAQLDALGHIDLIVGGSPCQGFSVAGKQEGLKDVRSKLAIDYLRVINTVKPKWIVWENVPGVFSTRKGMDFKLFTAALTHFGYGICWRVLDAQYFGVAQRRRRVFLVGYLGDWRPACKVLFESQSLPGYFETLEKKREDLARKAEARTGKMSTLAARQYKAPPIVLKAEKDPLCCDVGLFQTYENKAPTQLARQYKDPPIILDDQGGSVMNVSEDNKVGTLRAETHNHQPIVTESYRIGSYHSNSMKSDNHNSGIYKTETANTLDASDPTPACQQGGIAVCSHARVRKLTPKECLRLQGFPDDWFDGVEGYSDTAAYKAIGNSMAVPCMRWIGERIQEVEKESNDARNRDRF